MSEGSQKGVYATHYVDQSEHTVNIGGTDYHSEITVTELLQGWMIMIHCLLLDMAEVHEIQFLEQMNNC